MEAGLPVQELVAQVSGQEIEPVAIQVRNTMALIALEIQHLIPVVQFHNVQVIFAIISMFLRHNILICFSKVLFSPICF
jgi:hypothetical protein